MRLDEVSQLELIVNEILLAGHDHPISRSLLFCS